MSLDANADAQRRDGVCDGLGTMKVGIDLFIPIVSMTAYIGVVLCNTTRHERFHASTSVLSPSLLGSMVG